MSYSLRIDDSSSNTLFSLRNDGVVNSAILIKQMLRSYKRKNKIKRLFNESNLYK